jgi:hypothetical protein
VIVATCGLVSGCTTVQSIPSARLADPTASVRVGDIATCTLHDGTQTTFKVKAIEPTALVGETQRVLIADIGTLHVERLDLRKTAAKTGRVALAVVAVPVLLLLSGGLAIPLL